MLCPALFCQVMICPSAFTHVIVAVVANTAVSEALVSLSMVMVGLIGFAAWNSSPVFRIALTVTAEPKSESFHWTLYATG